MKNKDKIISVFTILVMILTMLSTLLANAQTLSRVVVSEVKQIPLNKTINLHATVHGKRNVILTSGVEGLLTYVVEPGTEVKQDDEIARIDLLPLNIEKAEQEALIRRAQINLKHFQRELKRLQSLIKNDNAAQYQVEQTLTQVELTRSDIEIAKIKLKKILDKIERAVMKAPFSGIISERFAMPNSYINRTQAVVNLLDTKNLEVRLHVPVKYLSYFSKGSLLDVSNVDSKTGEISQAIVSAIIPMTDARSQTFELRADILRKHRIWATGQLVEVTVPLDENRSAIVVNRDALILRADGTYVVKIDDKNKVHRIKVNVTEGQGNYVAVQATEPNGILLAGDKVALRGAERLKDQQQVTIQETAQ